MESAAYTAGVLVVVFMLCSGVTSQTGRIKCYTDNGRPQRCIPEFVNAAFGKAVVANNTCGSSPSRYCVQTGVSGAKKRCQICDGTNPMESHPSSYTTDIKDDTNKTWWQSETLYENKNAVWLSLDLGKTFDITYIRIRYHTSRPQSFKISKKISTNPNAPWIPYQYYSGSCEKQYSLSNRAIVTSRNEKVALCTNEYSGISPLSGGNVAFSTLEHRPGAYNFDSNAELQDWVTGSAIRIDLDKLNTFGDDIFEYESVLRSYYYAISDWAIGGRCKCNGHASECITRVSEAGKKTQLVCRCEHSTAGDDCEKCAPLYNDRPWLRATGASANPCQRCECNNLADACVFDPILYRTQGRGGRCISCKNNTAGINCERCKGNHYRSDVKEACKPCSCNAVGSRSLQCNTEGICECRPGVTGDKCDRCSPGYFSFSEQGCMPCLCSSDGSVGQNCDATGQCQCKSHVTGKQCDECKTGYFDLDKTSNDGCKACFCHGHGSSCTAQSGIGKKDLRAEFASSLDGWRIVDADGNDRTSSARWSQRNQYLQVEAIDNTILYLVAPSYFLGNRLSSYGKTFSFVYGVTRSVGIVPSEADIIFEGAGLKASFPITAQGNPAPADRFLRFEYKLREPVGMKAFDFQNLLSQLTSIRIRVTYLPRTTGVIDSILLESTRVVSENSPDQVTWLEQCLCEIGYSGQFCENCDRGYTREANRTDAFGSCVPCECNGHSDQCDPSTGICQCQHNTQGKSCDSCIPGYYGNPTRGTSQDCQPCPCVFGSECLSIGAKVQCTDCPPGHEGDLCEKCQDGYFGDPQGKLGEKTGCKPCTCNENIDGNAIGNCNTTTGECLKCIYNTKNGIQQSCEECRNGFFGDALALPKGQCKACNCFQNGTVWPTGVQPSVDELSCDAKGQCQCRENVTGLDCGSCEPGLWGVATGDGCRSCMCDVTGSNSSVCDIQTGQCECKTGVGAQQCNDCAPGHFEFSEGGCKACDCHPDGAQYVNCTSKGECVCRPGVLGAKCDSCPENKYNLTIGCISCPRCFNLVRDAVDSLRTKLKELDSAVGLVNVSNIKVTDDVFEAGLNQLLNLTDHLEDRIRMLIDSDQELYKFFSELKANFSALEKVFTGAMVSLSESRNESSQASSDTSMAEDTIDKIKDLLNSTSEELSVNSKKALEAVRSSSEGLGDAGTQLKAIAAEARMLADGQESASNTIDMLATMAHASSTDALNKSSRANDMERALDDDLVRLSTRADDALKLAEELRRQLAALKKQSADATTEAMEIYENATMPLPDFMINRTKAVAEAQLEDAMLLINKSDELIAQTKPLIDNLTKNEAEARRLMAKGTMMHDEADAFNARAKDAYNKAKGAQEKAERTAAEAKRTLDILKGFNEQVEKSKKNATEALKLVALIRQLIAEARNNSKDAEEKRAGAESLADSAHSALDSGNDTLNAVKQDLMTAHSDLANQMNASLAFELSINETLRDVKNASMALGAYKRQAEEDASTVMNAHKTATMASDDALSAQGKLDAALSAVDEIAVELANMDGLDLAKLEDAETRFAVANNTILGELEAEIEKLKMAAVSHESSLTMFELSLEPLRKQIAHADEIYKAFPKKCYKKVPIPESTG